MATGRIGTTPVLTTRWSKAPAAGTTSLSGLDDNSVSLVYSVGYEQVYLNGALLSRTNDYTATNGTTITLTNATVAGDIVEVFANAVVPLTDTYTQTVANGKFINNTLTTTTGDIIYASAANTPARLGIGSTSQVLTVSGGVPTWTTPSSGGMTELASGSLSSTAINLSGISGSYTDLRLVIRAFRTSTNNFDLRMRFQNDSNSRYAVSSNPQTTVTFNQTSVYIATGQNNATSDSICIVNIFDYANTTHWKNGVAYSVSNDYLTPTSASILQQNFVYNQTGAIDQINIISTGTSFATGTYTLYGVK